MSSADKLQTFLTLADCHSFTETAKKLYTSQPTVSNHIQQLENQYGAVLFNRSGKSIVLTPKGKILYEYALKITSLYEEAAARLQHDAPQILNVYVSHYLGTYVLPDIVKRFNDKYPEESPQIHTCDYVELQKNLLQNRTNFSIMPLYETDDYIQTGYDVEPLFVEDLLLVISPEHPWRKRKMLYTRDLNFNRLLVPENDFIQSSLHQALKRSHVKVNIEYKRSIEAIKEEVRGGDTLAFLPYYAVNKSITSGELITRPVAGLQIKRSNGFVLRRNTKLTALEQIFYTYIKQSF
jgi:DNA-binding transcriptional LysR family regulator